MALIADIGKAFIRSLSPRGSDLMNDQEASISQIDLKVIDPATGVSKIVVRP